MSFPPLTLLALETATPACSVALFHKGMCFSRYQVAPQAHTQLVLPMIQAVLDEAAISLKDLEALAVGRGPGSFTGVRIAISVAQALSYGLNIPVYPISTLEALAECIERERIKESIKIVAALDARMQEVYKAVYQCSDGGLTCVEAERLCSPEELVHDEEIIAIGSGWDMYYPEKVHASYKAVYPDAKAVGKIALRQWMQGELGVCAQAVLPVYLRDKVAEKRR